MDVVRALESPTLPVAIPQPFPGTLKLIAYLSG